MTKPPVPLPVLRAAMFAFVGTALGVSAHHLVAEGPMSWRRSVFAAAVLFGIGLLGTRRPRSLGGVMAVCGSVQAALHLWLMTGHTRQAPVMSTPMAVPAHTHHPVDTHAAWHERLHASLMMTAVHAIAAAAVAVLLYRADTACWSLARGLTHALLATRPRIATAWTLLTGRRAATKPGSLLLVRAWFDRSPPAWAVLADVVVRRGPPQTGPTHAI
ncbi:hypothetical protein [Streptomyces shenzhenensis]|uniref:hypothetical protein n=1 Tax=Streptomyces shenzhenensis TaxID=943815 RepID=UPI0036B4847B